VVPRAGLEPASREAEDFETSVYTNSTIWANNTSRVLISVYPSPLRLGGMAPMCRPFHGLAFPHIYQFHHLSQGKIRPTYYKKMLISQSQSLCKFSCSTISIFAYNPTKQFPMPKKTISPSGPWIDRINPPLDDIDAIIEKYGFHELDREAILEANQYARIDTYDDYLFLVLHFPKYEPHTERYIHNELNIFIAKDYLITFRYYQSTTMKKIYDRYEDRLEKNLQVEPAFLLYEILEGFLDKTMKMLERFSRDLKTLEYELFSARGTNTIRNIMTRKRNIITLKHMMKPQIAVLKMIEIRMKERFSEEVEFYFENLEDKLDKIFSEIQLLQENIDSMEDTLKSIFELDTNSTIKYLTVFSAFMLPLTLATSFFGMNVES
jgi:magnesium transporter